MHAEVSQELGVMVRAEYFLELLVHARRSLWVLLHFIAVIINIARVK